MARAVFRGDEVLYTNGRVILEPPFQPQAEDHAENVSALEEEYTGPTADELRREAEMFKSSWEKEKASMTAAARSQSEAILADARERAAEILENAKKDAQSEREKGVLEAEKIKERAEKQSREASEKAAADAEVFKEKAGKEGFSSGEERGFEAGMAEAKRLIERMHVALERLQAKRSDILNEAERQIVDLTLLIARKVVKTISESQKEAVLENIRAALEKVKICGSVIIKVNLADLELSTEHLKEFTDMVEAPGVIQIVEDSSVDKGGCVVETDFGEIDARISHQLAELEARILEISPIQKKGR
ncbi:MAG: flagellar assembly protein FliH [Spirochaetaceae bacterium]|jgi:flagellar assembly protein FliH|nr:flagellar assembly protein FliH [Spirochaetaceae bacterium]